MPSGYLDDVEETATSLGHYTRAVNSQPGCSRASGICAMAHEIEELYSTISRGRSAVQVCDDGLGLFLPKPKIGQRFEFTLSEVLAMSKRFEVTFQSLSTIQLTLRSGYPVLASPAVHRAGIEECLLVLHQLEGLVPWLQGCQGVDCVVACHESQQYIITFILPAAMRAEKEFFPESACSLIDDALTGLFQAVEAPFDVAARAAAAPKREHRMLKKHLDSARQLAGKSRILRKKRYAQPAALPEQPGALTAKSERPISCHSAATLKVEADNLSEPTDEQNTEPCPALMLDSSGDASLSGRADLTDLNPAQLAGPEKAPSDPLGDEERKDPSHERIEPPMPLFELNPQASYREAESLMAPSKSGDDVIKAQVNVERVLSGGLFVQKGDGLPLRSRRQALSKQLVDQPSCSVLARRAKHSMDVLEIIKIVRDETVTSNGELFEDSVVVDGA